MRLDKRHPNKTPRRSSRIPRGATFSYPLTDTECCTNETLRTCRSTWRNHWPRLRSPAASPALRPTTFSSFPPTARAAALDAVGLIIYVTRIRLQAKLEHRQGCPGLPPPARHYAKPPAPQPQPHVTSAPPSRRSYLTPRLPHQRPRQRPGYGGWPELIEQSLEKRAGRSV